MRKHGRTDANQREIVDGLRKRGATVQVLSSVGGGCPDILVGYYGRNYLLEIKDGKKPPSARELTPEEKDWHYCWQGRVSTVEDLDEAWAVITGGKS